MSTKLTSKIMTTVSKSGYKPMGLEELSATLGVHKGDRDRFKQEVDDLHRLGRLVIGEDQTIHLADQEGTIVGIYRANPKGFGFVVPSDPEVVEDLYVPAEAAMGAVTSDLVQAKVFQRKVKGRMRLYGRIEKILSRGKNKFIGTLTRGATQWMVQTDGKVIHHPIIVDDVSAKGGRTGDRVVVQLTEYPQGMELARGVVLELLGPSGEPAVELQAIIREYDFPVAFPETVHADLEAVIEQFNLTVGRELIEGKIPTDRLDLRDKLIITIDPVTARDFDDAFNIDLLDDGYELGVHIADVSAFVAPESPLDVEARTRGNSVYLPRHVIPMIPEALSNGLCSLQEGQDRLTKSAFIRYDRHGNVKSARYANSVIHSKKRLHYEQASAALEGKHDNLPQPVADLMITAQKLARAIYARREKEGMLHLDLPDVELEYNEKGEFIDAHPADTSFSHTIIEMFMVEANEAVARLLDSYNVPFLRRVHEDPSPQATEQLRDLLTLLGYRLPKEPNRGDFQQLIESVAEQTDSFAVNYAVLRSLQRAEYSPRSVGHYALASTHYCHFTSPIRRYPDLDVHRLLDIHFEGKLKKLAPALRQDQQQAIALGEHCSLTERQAENAERQLKETLILQLLAEHVGDVYDGLVTGISSLGPFVQLRRYLIEGLIPVEELGEDLWEVNQDSGYIQGRRSGKKIKIGDPLQVAVVSADAITRRLNLALAEELVSQKGSKKKSKGRGVKAKKNAKKQKTSARSQKRKTGKRSR